MNTLEHAAQAAARRRPGVPPKPFSSFVEQTEGCWLWRGTVLPNGYGEYNNGGRHSAHRWAWMEAHGSIPPGLQVCHACDTKLCVQG